jgi:Fe-S cluster biogenesis protein NfuA
MADREDVRPDRLDADAVEQRLRRLDGVLAQLEQIPGRTAELAMGAVELLLDVYAELTEDDLVRHLLVLHGLHPDPPRERVGRAVAELGAVVARHGATVELVGVDDGHVHIGVSGASSGCGSSAAGPVGLEDAVRDCLAAAAPELGVEITQRAVPRLIPVTALRRRPQPDGAA